jgi:hypothetical protein
MMGLFEAPDESLNLAARERCQRTDSPDRVITDGPNHELQMVSRELRPVCIALSLLVKLTLNQHLQLLNRFVRIRSLGRDE